MLEEGVISPFYLDKIKDDQGTRVPSALSMSILYYRSCNCLDVFMNMKHSLMKHISL